MNWSKRKNSGFRYIRVIFMISLCLFFFGVQSVSAQTPVERLLTTVLGNGGGNGSGEQADQLRGSNVEWHITFGKILLTLLVIAATSVILKYVTRTLESMAERSTVLRLAIKRLIPFIPTIVWGVVIYEIIMGIFAPPIQTIIAVSASAGIAIGFASQDILKNIFAGVMILLDRPFQVGDKIEIGDYYGEVKRIGLRSVRVETPDDSTVSIPNEAVMTQSVSNSNSGESNAQVVSEFYLPPDIDLVQAKKIAYRAAAVSRYVFLNKPIAVIIKNEVHFGQSMLKMRLKAYVLDIRYEFPFASEMTQIVMEEFLKAELITTEQIALHT